MMRLIVCAAELVCSVPKVKWPVFRDAERRFHGLEVAQLTDEHDVGVLAEGGAQRQREALRVAVHLALVDQAALVRVDVLDRILDGEDVIVALQVDLVDHRGERRRLAAAGRTGDEHEAARPLGEVGQHGRQAELLEAADLFGNQPIDGADRPALVEHVAAKAREPLDAEGEVELQRLLEALLLRVGEHAVGEGLGVGRRHVGALETLQVPVHAHLRRRADGDVEVGALQFDRLLQQFR